MMSERNYRFTEELKSSERNLQQYLFCSVQHVHQLHEARMKGLTGLVLMGKKYQKLKMSNVKLDKNVAALEKARERFKEDNKMLEEAREKLKKDNI